MTAPLPGDSPAPAQPNAAEIKSRALEAGFDRAGIATLEALEHGGAFLRWLERGDHAGMGYLEKRIEERLHPQRIFPGARSVLCVALRYHPLTPAQAMPGQVPGECPDQVPDDVPDNVSSPQDQVPGECPSPNPPSADPAAGDLWPRVARYAHGRDYHNLMGKRLNRLARELRRDYPDCRTKVYVDTGPVLERELAARAGLGVVGKNSCLLSREGSWFLLGEIFLSFDLQPDEPLTDLCGRCTRCLDACPTGALAEPFRLDSNRCISYWTIEHRGPVPREMRPGLEDWVFGCDICQDVCPWNLRPAVAADQPDFHLPAHRGELNLLSLLALEEDEYRQRFQGSAMQRARLEGLKRNAATAMGHRGEGRYVPALATALGNEAEDLAVRCHAAWALGRIGDGAALLALRRASALAYLPELQREVDLALEEAEATERSPASGAPATAS